MRLRDGLGGGCYGNTERETPCPKGVEVARGISGAEREETASETNVCYPSRSNGACDPRSSCSSQWKMSRSTPEGAHVVGRARGRRAGCYAVSHDREGGCSRRARQYVDEELDD